MGHWGAVGLRRQWPSVALLRAGAAGRSGERHGDGVAGARIGPVTTAFRRHHAVFAAGALTTALAAALAACTSAGGEPAIPAAPATRAAPAPSPSPPAPSTTPALTGAFPRLPARGHGHLAPGSDPHVLPADVLIADEDNRRMLLVDPQGRLRWRFPVPGNLAPGQVFGPPDDAFVSPDGRQIIATQEMDDTISVIDIATGHVTRHYGHPGAPGSGPGYLSHPDDAMLLPGGDLLAPDIINCRILLFAPGRWQVVRRFGGHGCAHHPPAAFGSPNGAFPMKDGHYLVTEINGDWVDEMSLTGHVYWSTHPPGVAYPSDTNEVRPGRYVTADYSHPGQIVVFDRAGRTLWRFRPTGAQALNHPSLALPLPNGDILVNDDYNNRVIVISPAKNRIVWQYGHYGAAGSAPGFLNNPDGVDLAPPFSLLVTHAATMGRP
jgi:PQQ-like domain